MSHLGLHNFDFSKKVFFHPEKIVAYKQGKRPFPTTLEVDLINICNHRCSFCNCSETLSRDRSSLDAGILKKRLKEAYELGTRGISYTGGGEPLVHKQYLEIIEYSKHLGMDNGTITNGSLIGPKNVKDMVRLLQWIRISMAGGDTETYKAIQGVDHFERVLDNIRLLVQTKKETNAKSNIGIRILVTPRNLHTLTNLANILADIKINYLQCAADQFSKDGGEFWNSTETQGVFRNVHDILVKNDIMLLKPGYFISREGLDFPRTCYAHFFHCVITAEGDLTYCKNSRGHSKYLIGNINKNTLTEIWNSEKVKEIESWVKPFSCGLFCKDLELNKAMESFLYPDFNMSPNFVS